MSQGFQALTAIDKRPRARASFPATILNVETTDFQKRASMIGDENDRQSFDSLASGARRGVRGRSEHLDGPGQGP
jgi:hypothetical protein